MKNKVWVFENENTYVIVRKLQSENKKLMCFSHADTWKKETTKCYTEH